MSHSIDVPDELWERLVSAADAIHSDPEDLALALISDALRRRT